MFHLEKYLNFATHQKDSTQKKFASLSQYHLLRPKLTIKLPNGKKTCFCLTCNFHVQSTYIWIKKSINISSDIARKESPWEWINFNLVITNTLTSPQFKSNSFCFFRLMYIIEHNIFCTLQCLYIYLTIQVCWSRKYEADSYALMIMCTRVTEKKSIFEFAHLKPWIQLKLSQSWVTASEVTHFSENRYLVMKQRR